ncbi:MAG: hypothetical protein E7L01_09640 [Paenibacillus macerans]|uniref:hypothetical protein n=1 Tax=Paenibacillus macerans TaxID=44252 RepID=UPI001F107AA6|nr:hypothetical protein [Paenibacillus macerans]MDU5945967.1 hypothetical protein [Paenibacillus macerans]MDU7473587.1 hypothetical protein [Paenibacillus macerans]MEC0139171.1 hypothetical protein [Paenibacillus macerans]UMV47252.1 hypothetical protein LMZ02_28000 [Paenibacillus macerans]
MIVLFSWIFILGCLGLLVGLIWMVIKFATKKNLRLKRTGLFLLSGLAVALIGAIGAISSISDPTSTNETDTKISFSQKSKDEDLAQERSVANPIIVSTTPTTDQQSASEKADPLASLQKSIEDYIFENFGGSGDEKFAASWYGSVDSINIQPEGEYGYVIAVDTTLYHDDEGKKFAKEIPPAFLGWANSKENNVPVWAVVVNDQNGKPLIRKDNPSSPAAAQ